MQTEIEPWATAQPWRVTNTKMDRFATLSFLAGFVAMVGVVIYGYLETPGWVGVANKTFWDYLVVLLPLVLASQVQYFGQRITTLQAMGQRRNREESRQEAVVEAYIDQTTNLAIDVQSRDQEESDKICALAWARTRRVLELVDAARKESIVRFLYDARLIQGKRPAVSLDKANLRRVNLSDAELSESNLTGADLSSAQVTPEQLAQVRSLAGATMPNGPKYEDWLKDK